MKTFGNILKAIFRVIGGIIKFSILLVVAIIATIIIIANLEGVAEGGCLLVTWILFAISNMGKRTKKEEKEAE